MKSLLYCCLGAVMLLLAACKKDEPSVELPPAEVPIVPAPDTVDFGSTRTVNVMGVVRDESGNSIAGALVSGLWSNQTTTTDARGFFRLEELVCYETNASITVSKSGYFKGSRTWIPTSGGDNRIEIQLLSDAAVGNFQADQGGSVEAEGFTLNFPPNGMVLNGSPYQGNVSVSLNAIDPTELITMSRQMPGDLSGMHNGERMALRSMGMAAIELRSESGEILQPAAGSPVEMRCIIPSDMQASAPQSIPLWSFNEALGLWDYEGAAQRVGNAYVGSASHFSYWNFDVESAGVNYTLTVNYSELPIGFYPLDNAVLMLSSASAGTIPGTTGTNGQVSGLVPSNEVMQLQVFLPCGDGYQEVYTVSVGPFTQDIQQTIEINSLPYLTTVQGVLQDCSGNFSTGYIWWNDERVVYTEDGSFLLTTCSGSNQIQAYCFNNGQAGTGFVSDLIISPGLASDVTLVCEDCFPIGAPGAGVTDIDGNNYPTVINGTQEWMAANLTVTRFSNGDAISEVTDNAQWAGTTTPAWCYLDNNTANNVIFGKLYHGSVSIDTRNVCPSGWHLPSNDDWQTLITTLGGSSVAASAMRTTGTIQDGTGFWPFDNVISNNVSGFSAQPGEFRNTDGTFTDLVVSANWWSSTEATATTNFTVGIYSFSNTTFNQDLDRAYGMSIRCIRD
ncbi:MAG: FISUMP domain-containing protein [Flavobacteriales bacterium]